jgi:hypothetical protein
VISKDFEATVVLDEVQLIQLIIVIDRVNSLQVAVVKGDGVRGYIVRGAARYRTSVGLGKVGKRTGAFTPH